MVRLVFERTWKTWSMKSCGRGSYCPIAPICLHVMSPCSYWSLLPGSSCRLKAFSLFPFLFFSVELFRLGISSSHHALYATYNANLLIGFIIGGHGGPLIILSIDEMSISEVHGSIAVWSDFLYKMLWFTPSLHMPIHITVKNKQNTWYHKDLLLEIRSSCMCLSQTVCRSGFMWLCWTHRHTHKHTETLVCSEWIKRKA